MTGSGSERLHTGGGQGHPARDPDPECARNDRRVAPSTSAGIAGSSAGRVRGLRGPCQALAIYTSRASFLALSVRSQVKLGSVRPKCP